MRKNRTIPLHHIVRNSFQTVAEPSNEESNEEESNDTIAAGNEQLDMNETNNTLVSPSIPIVRIVENPGGMLMLDFCDEASHDLFVARCFVTKDEMVECNRECSVKTFIDAGTWAHLLAYSVLVGKPVIANAREEHEMKHSLRLKFNGNTAFNESSHDFIPLEDAVKSIVKTFLSLDRLFAWQTLVDALNEGKLSWKDIRHFLSIVRSSVPFFTQDGLLRVVNTHLTFHQFVAFARMVEEHTSVVAFPPNTDSDDIQIICPDILPVFHLMTPEEQKIELMASTKDKVVRNSAQAAGLIIPTSADVECNIEWHLYTQWWSVSDIRNNFLSREVLFAEQDAEVRRNAEKCGVSMRGRHSNDKPLRRTYLRKFGKFYFGVPEEGIDLGNIDCAGDEAIDSTVQFHTYDFSTGQTSSYQPEDQDRASPVKMPIFRNKSWRPLSAVERELIDRDTTESSLDIFEIQPNEATSFKFEYESVAEESPSEERLIQKRSDDEAKQSKSIRDVDKPTKIIPEKLETLIVNSKVKQIAIEPQPQSFRRQYLGCLTSEIANFTSLVNEKDSRKLRGKTLLRSKVKLVVMLRKILGPLTRSIIEAVAPEHVDIFSHALRNARVPAAQLLTPMKVASKPVIVDKELLQRAKAHYDKTLCRKTFMEMVHWTRKVLAENARNEREALQEELKIQMMFAKATTAYTRSLMSRFFTGLRDQSARQRNERAIENTPLEPVVEHVPEEVKDEEFSFIARPPNVERKYFSLEDERSRKFRTCFSRDKESTYLFSELECMALMIVGRSRRSGLDVVCRDEYEQNFERGVELRRSLHPQTPLEIGTLDWVTLQKMKREKLVGASNLFDVPREFIDLTSSLSDAAFDVEYRTREQWRGLLNQV